MSVCTSLLLPVVFIAANGHPLRLHAIAQLLSPCPARWEALPIVFLSPARTTWIRASGSVVYFPILASRRVWLLLIVSPPPSLCVWVFYKHLFRRRFSSSRGFLRRCLHADQSDMIYPPIPSSHPLSFVPFLRTYCIFPCYRLDAVRPCFSLSEDELWAAHTHFINVRTVCLYCFCLVVVDVQRCSHIRS